MDNVKTVYPPPPPPAPTNKVCGGYKQNWILSVYCQTAMSHICMAFTGQLQTKLDIESLLSKSNGTDMQGHHRSTTKNSILKVYYQTAKVCSNLHDLHISTRKELDIKSLLSKSKGTDLYGHHRSITKELDIKSLLSKSTH